MRLSPLPLLLGSLSLCAGPLAAFTFTGAHWYVSTVPMHLQLGAAPGPLSDGSASWGASAEDALAIWNSHMANMRFSVVRDSTVAKAQGNRVNNVFFDSKVYGEAWGPGVLAMTLTYTSGGSQTTETDVVFNSTLGWDSYRGSQRYGSSGAVYDFHRVALHEFGHALGLDHPDQAGQSVIAMMNSRITNLDAISADDIAGAQALYGSTITAAPAPAPAPTYGPMITTNPVGRTVNVGEPVTLTVSVSGTAPFSYSWRKDGTAISGATRSGYTLGAVQATDAGAYTVRVTNSVGSVTSSAAVVTVNSPPAITSAPTAQTVSAGDRVVLSVAASGNPAPSYQWQRNGENIAGATSASLVLTAASPHDAGTYTVVITNSAGSLTTAPVVLAVSHSQLVNLSTRGFVPPGGALTAGFVIRGSEEKPILVRGLGPALAGFGVDGTLSDPQLAVIAQEASQTIAVNDSWSVGPQLATAFQSVGAFALPAGSPDSASQVRLVPGAYTTRITSGSGANAGVAMAEVYDADSTATRSRLINLSTLGYTGPGDSTLVAGFTVQGSASKRLLIRAVGPGLSAYNVAGALKDPKLEVVRLGEATAIAANDNWGGTDALQSIFGSAGAFPLATGSRDAAIVLELPAGGYTVMVLPADENTGHVLLEIYDLDP